MKKTKVILVTAFLLVFAAGLVVGRMSREVRLRAERPDSAVARELGLTAQQREQMRKIWEGMRPLMKQHREARLAARKHREQRVRSLLNEDQLQGYERIDREYQQELKRLDAERRAAFEQAQEKTRAILTPQQQKKFRAFRDRFRGGPGRRGPRHGPPPDHNGRHRKDRDREPPPPPAPSPTGNHTPKTP